MHRIADKTSLLRLAEDCCFAGMMWAWDLTVTLGIAGSRGSWMARAVDNSVHWVGHAYCHAEAYTAGACVKSLIFILTSACANMAWVTWIKAQSSSHLAGKIASEHLMCSTCP